MQLVANELPLAAQHDSAINHVAFSADGQWLATADVSRFVRVWHYGKLIREYDLRNLSDRFRALDMVRAIAVSPQGDRLIALSGETVFGFDLLTGAEIWGYDAPMTWGFLVTTPQSVAFSKTGSMVIAQSNNRVLLWSRTPSGYHQVAKWGDNDAPHTVRFMADGLRVVGADYFAICTWDSNGTKLSKYRPTRKVFALDASPIENVIAYRTLHEIQIWDGNSGQQMGLAETPAGLPTLSFSPTAKYLAFGHESGIKLVDFEGKLVGEYDSGAQVKTVQFTPDGNHVAFSTSDGKLKLWPI